MGEVYRARDTKLGREVALKILPELFAQDPDPSTHSGSSRAGSRAERLARFGREARTLAALNHPNIAHLYGIEEAGADPRERGRAPIPFLVMELVEGEDLAQRLARGPVPLVEVLPIARQIAEALEAAHEQAIIHRDLKPANIKVRDDGTVKVLDFGLAKAMDPLATSGAADALANSPTLTARATQMGMILGTAAYMAPEQARGRAVDKRADVWSFGVVLYEMLTGRRLFDADDTSETLAAVLRQEISLDALPASTPPRLTRLMGRCLERDPKLRLRDIGEARIELARLEAGGPDSTASARTIALGAVVPLWRRALPWAIVAGLLLTLVAVFARDRTSSTMPAVVTRLQIALPHGVELYTFVGASVSLSPDGSTLAFMGVGSGDGVRRVYQRRLDQFDITPVRGSESAVSCLFSPDGSELLVNSADTSTRRIRLSDGLIETVTLTTSAPWGAWLPSKSRRTSFPSASSARRERSPR